MKTHNQQMLKFWTHFNEDLYFKLLTVLNQR